MAELYISARAGAPLCEYLESRGNKLIKVSGSAVYDAVSDHPDIYMCAGRPGSGNIIFGDERKLGRDYPENIIYNAVILDKYLIHNLRYTDDAILKYADANGLIMVNVKQGYTKCSCVVVDGSSVITADRGIANVLSNYPDIDVLTVDSRGVLLPGHAEGFLGGASGRVGSEIIFNGDLSRHPDFERIQDFIRSRGLEVKYFKEYPLIDIGTIIEGR